MAETNTTADAEKAYAAASEQATAKPAPAAKAEAAAPAPAAKAVEAAPVAPKAAPVAKAAAPKPPVAGKAATPVPARKVAKTKPAVAVAKPIRQAAVKKTVSKPVTKPTFKTKDTKTMATTAKKTADEFTSKIQDAVKDARQRAETAFEKTQAVVADANAFSRGNLEALVESGKIVATGVQAMGKSYAEQVKATFEALQADAKDLTTVKSPKEFVELQGKLARKYFDNAVAYNSKSAEAALKLANDAFQPLSSRVSLAVEKVRKAA